MSRVRERENRSRCLVFLLFLILTAIVPLPVYAADYKNSANVYIPSADTIVVISESNKVSTSTTSTEEDTSDPLDVLDDYNFSEINEELNANSDYTISFQDVVTTIIGNGDTSQTSNGFLKALNLVLLNSLNSNKTAVVQIILLAVLSAVISCFGLDFNKGQVNDTAQMVISITLITILIASFYSAVTICSDAVNACIDIYKAIIPVFFSAVTFASGSVSSAVYYELVLIMITVVNLIFGTVLISLNKIYVLFSMADSVTGEERFSKAAEFIPTIIKWTCRTVIIVFTGLGGIKGMIAPMTDSMKKNVLYKALQLIPGIGNSVETVSQTVIGAGTIVKNGIGTAAIVVIIMISLVPLLKLVVLTCLFKVTAAAIEPIADKRIVKAVNSISIAIGSLAVIVLVTLSLFVLMAGIICVTTNLNYMT